MTLLDTGQWQVRSLLMGPDTPYRVLASSNSFALSVRAEQTQPRPYTHGSLVGAEWANARVMPIRIMIDAPPYTESAWLDALDALTAAFAPVEASGETVELYRNIDGREFVWFGRTRMVEPETDLAAGGYGFVQCAFEAADPRRYAATETTQATGLPLQQGGLAIPHGVLAAEAVAITGADDNDTAGSDPAVAPSVDAPAAGLMVCAWTSFEYTGTYTLPGAMTEVVQLTGGAYVTSAVATETVTAGATGTRAATAGQSDQWSTATAVLPGDVTVVDTAWDYQADTSAVGATVTGAEAGDWLLAVHALDWDTAGAAAAPDGGGWELIAASPVTSDASRTLVWAREVGSAGPQTVTITGVGTATDTYLTVLLARGVEVTPARAASGGLTVPLTIPGRLTGGYLDLVNDGNTNTGVTVRIDGPATEPRLILRRPDGTVQSIRFLVDLGPGQWITLDTTRRLALLNGSVEANLRGGATWDMDAYPVQPGANVLRFLSADFDETSQLTASHRSAWW